MKKQWVITLGILALVFAMWGRAEALNFADDNCAENPFVVDTAAEAARVANGYDCPGVTLEIRTSLVGIADAVLPIKAKTIKIEGPLTIINPIADILFMSEGLGAGVEIDIDQATIKARNRLAFQCKGFGCTIEVDNSEIVASLTLLAGDPGGEVNFIASGDVRIENTTLWGGRFVEIESKDGKVTWFCPSGGGCRDPLTSNKAVALCGVPPGNPPAVFPCTLTFNTAADLRAVCISGVCGGGSKQMRVTAKLDVDIRGSTITALSHFTIESKEGNLLAGKRDSNVTNITAQELTMTAKGTVDISDAMLTASSFINIKGGSGCPAPPGVCVNGRRSDIEASDIVMEANNKNSVIDLCEGAVLNDLGADFPTLNGDSTPPFDPNVLDTAAECAGALPAPTIN